MAQWVKKLTAVAQVDVDAWVRSLAWSNGLKDLVLPQLWHKSQLWLTFSSWPRNFHMLQVWPYKFFLMIQMNLFTKQKQTHRS